MVQVMDELVRERFTHESDQLAVGIMSRATSAAANQRRSARVLKIAGAAVHMGGCSFGDRSVTQSPTLEPVSLCLQRGGRRSRRTERQAQDPRFSGARTLLPSAVSITSGRIRNQSGLHGTFVQRYAVLRGN